MPLYEYRCEKCKKSFTVKMSFAEHDRKKAACPKCKGRKVQPVIGSVNVKTSKKS